MGIARNLISLHVTDSQMMNVDMGLIHSIQSGYQIYLRDNVKQYIELKNKLIEFVNDLSKKAAEQGKALSESLAKNFTAFSSFLLSVVIVKAISQKDFTGELSPRVAYIGYALLTASAIHLVISVYLMNRELKAMEDSYERMRGRYSDLLAPQDVQQAFDDHYDYRQAMQNIRWKRNLYALAWALYIVLFTFLIAKLQTSDTAVIGSVPSVSAPSNDTTSIQMSATTISNTNSSNVIPLLDGTPIIPRISNTGPASATTP